LIKGLKLSNFKLRGPILQDDENRGTKTAIKPYFFYNTKIMFLTHPPIFWKYTSLSYIILTPFWRFSDFLFISLTQTFLIFNNFSFCPKTSLSTAKIRNSHIVWFFKVVYNQKHHNSSLFKHQTQGKVALLRFMIVFEYFDVTFEYWCDFVYSMFNLCFFPSCFHSFFFLHMICFDACSNQFTKKKKELTN